MYCDTYDEVIPAHGDDDFAALHADLLGWYVQGDRAAGNRFVRRWLWPRTLRILSGMRVDAARDDCLQTVTLRFLEREKCVGVGARGFAFWTRRIRWFIADFLRQINRLPGVALQDHHLDAGEPHAAGQCEATLFVELLARHRRATLTTHLDALSPAQRAYVLVSAHNVLGCLVDAKTIDWIAAQTNVPPATVSARLASLSAVPEPDDLLGVLFDAQRVRMARGKCLDALRKGRRRAIARLQERFDTDSARYA